MTVSSQGGPPHDVPDDSEEIEILEIEGMPEPDGPLADEEVEVPFEEEAIPPARAPEAVEEPREEPGSRERLIRLQADFDNLRKRIEREEAELRKVASIRLMTALLPVIDNFGRAVATQRVEGDDGAFRSGVELIHRQMLDVLHKEGLRAVEALGRPFDPTVHEAFATESASAFPPNTVIEEVQRGYLLHDRLLRPALVRVSVSPGTEPAAESADPQEVM
jgi:molecular chaperone GrpE